MVKSKSIVSILICVVLLSTTASSIAAPAPDFGVGVILKALAKYLGKESIEEASEKLVAIGGRELFERAAQKVAVNGGEEMVERVAKLTVSHGPDVLRAIDNVPASYTTRIVGALDDLPASQIQAASKRLAAGSQGTEVAESVLKFGTNALKTEVAHPGLGPKLIRAFGDDGAELVIGLSDDYAIALARHADELAALPAQQRKTVMELIARDKDKFFGWLGDFIKKNPNKVVFSTAATATLIANADNIFGGIRNRKNPDGSEVPGRVPGLLDVPMQEGTKMFFGPIASILRWAGIVAVFGFALIAGTHVWKHFRLNQLAVQNAETKIMSTQRSVKDSSPRQDEA